MTFSKLRNLSLVESPREDCGRDSLGPGVIEASSHRLSPGNVSLFFLFQSFVPIFSG